MGQIGNIGFFCGQASAVAVVGALWIIGAIGGWEITIKNAFLALVAGLVASTALSLLSKKD